MKMFINFIKNIVLFVIVGVLISVSVHGLFLLGNYYSVKSRQLDYKIFKESEQFNDSMIRDLENFRLEYAKASPEQKQIIKSTIQHRYGIYDANKLSYELKTFLQEMKQ